MPDKILNLTDPPITGYHYRAFPLSIIGVHPACWQWILEHFIQLRCSQHIADLYSILDFTDPNMLEYPTPWLNIQRIDRSLLNRYIPNLRQFVIDCIQFDHYVHLFVDEFFVPHRTPFQNMHVLHDLLIYGYNDYQREFHIAGFNEQGLYQQTIISYEQFQQATSLEQCTPKVSNPVLLLHLSTPVEEEFHIANVIEEFIHYHDGKHYLQPQTASHTNLVFGIDVYEALSQYLQYGVHSQLKLETRPFQLLLEHKQLMLRRLDFLFEHNYLKSTSEFKHTYAELTKSIVFVRNKIIKYQLTTQERIIVAAQEQLHTIQTKERECVKKIIDALLS